MKKWFKENWYSLFVACLLWGVLISMLFFGYVPHYPLATIILLIILVFVVGNSSGCRWAMNQLEKELNKPLRKEIK